MSGSGYDVNVGVLYHGSSMLLDAGREVKTAAQSFDTTLPSTAFGVFGTFFAGVGTQLLEGAREGGVTAGESLRALGMAVADTADDLDNVEEQAAQSQAAYLDQVLGGDE